MAEDTNVIRLRTPSGGQSSISVSRTGKGVELFFVRTMGDGPEVRSELLVRLSSSQAKETATAILAALAKAPVVT